MCEKQPEENVIKEHGGKNLGQAKYFLRALSLLSRSPVSGQVAWEKGRCVCACKEREQSPRDLTSRKSLLWLVQRKNNPCSPLNLDFFFFFGFSLQKSKY